MYAAIVVTLVAMVLNPADRTQMGATHLAASLVADLQLIAGAVVWAWAANASPAGLTPSVVSSVVSLSGGAFMANLVSVILLMVETAQLRR